MIPLLTNFCGITLKNPIVIAASPATESVNGILNCAQAGAGAVITKSIADYKGLNSDSGARRTYWNASYGLWATSTYSRETLTLKEGKEIIKTSLEKTSIPIIASVTNTNLEFDSWLSTCLAVEDAGAKMIQLDLFYLPQPICTDKNLETIINLINFLKEKVAIPIIVKLNIEIPAYLAAKYFTKSKIDGISLLDSVRVPSPFKISKICKSSYKFVQKLGMSSHFGSWQKPLTLHYAIILRRLSKLPLCVGGGLTNAKDALELILLGANSIQYATTILINGFDFIRKIRDDLELMVSEMGFNSISEINSNCLEEQYIDTEKMEPIFENAKAFIDIQKCIGCDRCLSLAFCEAIIKEKSNISILESKCDGCGLCINFCKTDALSLKKI